MGGKGYLLHWFYCHVRKKLISLFTIYIFFHKKGGNFFLLFRIICVNLRFAFRCCSVFQLTLSNICLRCLIQLHVPHGLKVHSICNFLLKSFMDFKKFKSDCYNVRPRVITGELCRRLLVYLFLLP